MLDRELKLYQNYIKTKYYNHYFILELIFQLIFEISLKVSSLDTSGLAVYQNSFVK